MNASLRALLSQVIDYAGLFPPSKLPLDQAIHNYARYRQDADAWMLGRFVIPAAQLGELEAFADLLQEEAPLTLSLLENGGEGVELLRAVGDDYGNAENLTNRLAGRVKADVCEVRLSPDYNFRAIILAATSCGPCGWALFMEGPLMGGQGEPLLMTLSKIARMRANRAAGHHPIAFTGYKLRCGGLEPSAFPPVEQVANVLSACRDAGVPLKFTAGLHHPIRRFDAGVRTHMHGFINVFVAGVLVHAHRLDEEALRAVIADEDAAHFSFTDAGLAWKDHHASTAEIAAARGDFVTSFGSCSFDEPRDDLRALGWL